MSDGRSKFTRTDSRVAPRPAMRPATPNVPIRTGDHAFVEWREGVRFGGRELSLSRMAGASQVHINVMVVPPGKQSCPFHYHMREEEHFYVLAGQVVLRTSAARYTMTAGDYVCFPAGTGVAHAFENPFEHDCTILAIGPRDEAEIAVYPDSGKAKLRAAQIIVPWPADSLDYWHGEHPDQPLAADPSADPADPADNS